MEEELEPQCMTHRRLLELHPDDASLALDTVRWALSRLLQEQARVWGGEELRCKNAGAGLSSDYPAKKKEQEPSTAEVGEIRGRSEGNEQDQSSAGDEDDAELDNSEVGKIRSLPQSLQLVGRKRKAWELGLGKRGQQSGKHELDKRGDSNNKEHDSVEGAVQEVDSGKAGASMAERVGAWMRTPCHHLVNLISYCLSKSLEQHPPFEGSVDEISTMGSLPGADENASLNGRNSVWLHKWLVKEVMRASSVPSAQLAVLHQIPLDWLIAYLTAAKPSVLVAIVLDDLVDNVVDVFNTKNSASLSIYLWRAGVLEYAALRGPVQTAAALGLLFSRMRLTGLEGEVSKQGNFSSNQREICKAVINVWLVMATLCPQLLGACFQHWMPLLTVDSILSYKGLIVEIMGGEMPSVPLWSLLEGDTGEEPRSILAWLSAVLSRRMSELASVGADIVLLLIRVIQMSNSDRMGRELPEAAALMLNTLYRVLSKCVVPCILGIFLLFLEQSASYRSELRSCLSVHKLGAEQMTGGEPLTSITKYEEYAGLQFVENLRMNVKKLWAELLQLCCTSTCDCCETTTTPSLGLDSSQDTKKKVAGPPGSHSHSTTKESDCGRTQPFIGICRLTILSCGKHALAEFLAEATIITPRTMEGFETKSLKRLLLVTEVMRMVSAQGRGAQVFENWAHLCVTHLSKSNDEQALHRALAIQHLLDPLFWQCHQRVLGPFSKLVLVGGEEQGDDELKNFSWKVVRTLLQKMLDCQWLQLLPLLHRKNALVLHLVVLHVLQYLSPDNDSRPQAVVVRLKGLLGIYFEWLDGTVANKALKKTIESEVGGDVDKWQSVRILEHLKRVIVQQTSLASTVFTVMVSSLLDYSFVHSARKADGTSPYNHRRNGNMRRQGIVANGRGSLPISSLVAGRLDKHGNFTLVEGAGGNQKSSVTPKYSFAEDIRRLKSGGLSSLNVYERERLGSRYSSGDQVKVLGSQRDDYGTELEEELVDTTLMEVCDLLRRAMKNAVFNVAENPETWSPHPATTLVTLMIDRLETPHEMAMTMEQYEEVLPKQVSSPRHIFLTDCFSQNQLLLEMLELVVKYRQSDEMLRCVEFIRILLADNISSWHSAHRTRRNPTLPPVRMSEVERLDRMQVIRLINIVADSGWLPQPLASTIEIVELIDGADIADLLLLVWRCMHHTMTFGAKSWSLSDHVIPQNGGSGDAQIHGVEEATKEGTYTDWEGHLFAILRQNIAQIGAHFAQVYPIHRTF